MKRINRGVAEKILLNEIDVKALLAQYPEFKEDVLKEISTI
jgi:hypothetical protein